MKKLPANESLPPIQGPTEELRRAQEANSRKPPVTFEQALRQVTASLRDRQR